MREEDESNIRDGWADTEDQVITSKIDVSGSPVQSDACPCEELPGDSKWVWVKGADFAAEAGGGSMSLYHCRYCGKEVLV